METTFRLLLYDFYCVSLEMHSLSHGIVDLDYMNESYYIYFTQLESCFLKKMLY